MLNDYEMEYGILRALEGILSELKNRKGICFEENKVNQCDANKKENSCDEISELINVELPCLINRILLTAKYGCNCNEEIMNAIRDNLKKISNDMINMSLDKDTTDC